MFKALVEEDDELVMEKEGEGVLRLFITNNSGCGTCPNK